MRRLFAICLGLLWWGLPAFAQEETAAAAEPARIALIPFANVSGSAEATQVVMRHVRRALDGQDCALVDSGSVALVLREQRIRNTAELTSTEVRALGETLAARYLLVGSIDRYEQADSSAEVALSGRLLDAQTGQVLWTSYATRYGTARRHLLSLRLGAQSRADRLARAAARELVDDFRCPPRPQRRPVTALRLGGRTGNVRACRRLAVVVLGNESSTRFAGHVLTGQLLHILHRRGFEVLDPGQVREVMLDSKELTQGEISVPLLLSLRMKLGVDFVLTGTVSAFDLAREDALETPAVAFEARLIDTAQGDLVWARAFDGEGDDSALLFDVGHIHGLTHLSHRLARDLGRDLRHLRARPAVPAPETTP